MLQPNKTNLEHKMYSMHATRIACPFSPIQREYSCNKAIWDEESIRKQFIKSSQSPATVSKE